MEIIIIGSSASIPTRTRGLPAVLVTYKGDRILFDCGEGTQRAIMSNNLGLMKINHIFITHWHADHFAGLTGLIQTMGMEGRQEPLHIYGPRETNENMKKMMSVGQYRMKFQVLAHDIDEGDEIVKKIKSFNIKIVPFRTKHDIPSLGYVVEEPPEQKANRIKMKMLGLGSSPLIKDLKAGKTVQFKGKKVKPEEVIDIVPGRKVVYTGDTDYSANTIKFSESADILIHDCTVSEDMQEERKGHSTPKKAATVAKRAKVKQLILHHISRKFDKNTKILLDEAKKVFKNTKVAHDLMKIELKPYRPE